MAGFRYFTIGFGITVVVLGAAAGSALGLVSGGPASPVPAKTAMSDKMASAASTAAPMGNDTVGKNSMGQAGVLHLDGMPAGAVRVWRNSQGRLEARLAVYGLTPGSSHNASIDGPNSTPLRPEVRFPAFTADSMGRASVTLTAASSTGALVSGSRFVIYLGSYASNAARNLPAEEQIASSGMLPASPQGVLSGLHPRSFGATGGYQGRLHGWAKIAYSPNTQALSVTVTAYGLAPGAHAAHIHLGSCQQQGAVKYMLMDFQANSDGNIINQTRTIKPVAPAPPHTGWYLNLHLGNGGDILAKGMPTLNFRPELCSDVTSVATSHG
jgi:Cu/Zn superoxide dismutase